MALTQNKRPVEQTAKKVKKPLTPYKGYGHEYGFDYSVSPPKYLGPQNDNGDANFEPKPKIPKTSSGSSSSGSSGSASSGSASDNVQGATELSEHRFQQDLSEAIAQRLDQIQPAPED